MTLKEYNNKRAQEKFKLHGKIQQLYEKYYRPNIKPKIYIDRICRETGCSQPTYYKAMKGKLKWS